MRTILCMVLLFRRAHPSACPVRLVCRISLCRSADRLACPSACPIQWVFCISLCRFSDRHAWCPSACPVRVRSFCLISLHCSSGRHAHPSACPVRSVCRISLCRSPDWQSRHVHVLAADFAFSHSHETLTLPLLLPYNGSCSCTRHDTNPPWYKLKASCCKEGIPKRFCNDDTTTTVWIFLRCKTQTWKFMCGRLPGKRIVVCSASKVTTCSSVNRTCQNAKLLPIVCSTSKVTIR